MAPRPDVSEARKQQILEAALVVFAQHGFNGATMDDIAAQAGLSKGALYWYFKSKDSIIDELVALFFDREIEEFETLLANDMTASERLRAATRLLIDEMSGLVDFMPIAYEYYATALRDEATYDFFQQFYQGFTTIFAQMIRQGVDAGEFRADVDPTLAAAMLASFYEGAIFIWIFNQENLDINDLVETAMTLFLDGLRPQAAQ